MRCLTVRAPKFAAGSVQRCPGAVCRVRIFCKGADSMIYARVAPGQPVADATSSHLAEMSRNGFRTLCMGQRDVEPAEFQVLTSSRVLLVPTGLIAGILTLCS